MQGVETIPVMMEAPGWRATGWLGLLTAGQLWIQMTDESKFDENVRQLHGQIQKLDRSQELLEASSDEAGGTSSSEAKEELERLRDDLVQTTAESSTVQAAALADPSQPATIPAGVPKLPLRYRATEQIRALKRLVLSTATSSASDHLAMPHRVGFFGALSWCSCLAN